MKGFIPVDIPTKKYIKAYIHSKLGEKPFMTTDHNLGNNLYILLQHETNERNYFPKKHYDAQVRIYISAHTWRHRGGFLNETNIRNYNRFVEQEIKATFFTMMDFFIEILPNFENNLPEVRRRIGIDIEIKNRYYTRIFVPQVSPEGFSLQKLFSFGR
jgi:hypothetical protein